MNLRDEDKQLLDELSRQNSVNWDKVLSALRFKTKLEKEIPVRVCEIVSLDLSACGHAQAGMDGDWQLGITRHFFSEGVQERFAQSRFDAIGEPGRIA